MVERFVNFQFQLLHKTELACYHGNDMLIHKSKAINQHIETRGGSRHRRMGKKLRDGTGIWISIEMKFSQIDYREEFQTLMKQM